MKENEDIIAYHEAGHFVALYAMGLYDEFTLMSIEPREGMSGYTLRNGKSLIELCNKLTDVSRNTNLFQGMLDFNEVKKHSMDICLPHVAFFFGGGALDEWKGRADNHRNSIDEENLSDLVLPSMFVLNFNNCMEDLKAIMYPYLKKVFEVYSNLVDIVAGHLLELRTIDHARMNDILEEWRPDDESVLKDQLLVPFANMIHQYHNWWQHQVHSFSGPTYKLN